jgi:hypothetical protein
MAARLPAALLPASYWRVDAPGRELPMNPGVRGCADVALHLAVEKVLLNSSCVAHTGCTTVL